jgi:DNA-directed RNA polymerase subunit beta'
MLSANNLLDPANGKPIVFPSQDMVLGINYLTREMDGAVGTGKFFDNISELILAIEAGSLSYNARISYKLPDGSVIKTTPGRVLFNAEMPPEIPFQNVCFGDKELKRLVGEVIQDQKTSVAVSMLDSIKDVGFKYATLFGATIGLSDMIVPDAKAELVAAADQRQSEIKEQYRQGHITQDERYNRVIEVWSKTTEDISTALMNELKLSQNGFNPLYLMADSGARGSKTQIRQLGGMRGLMAKPSGDIIEFPIRSNFKEGLSIIEFFISTNGARKGLADTALKTAEAGYLTRRLVDIAQDVVINEDDCGTINGIERTAMKDGDEIVESLADRIVGRYTLEKVIHPITGDLILDVNEEITADKSVEIEKSGIESVLIRTVLTCEARHGVCRKCYGRNLATNRPVDIGEAVGIIAAQSIGQPGTQLTMRTFHIGGTATSGSEENRVTFHYPVVINSLSGTLIDSYDGSRVFTRKGFIYYSRVLSEHALEGKKPLVEHDEKVVVGSELFVDASGKTISSTQLGIVKILGDALYVVAPEQRMDVRNGSELKVSEGSYVAADSTVVLFDPFSEPIIAEFDGKVQFIDIKLGTTLKEEVNVETGSIEKKITDHISETLQPRIAIVDGDGETLAIYFLPAASYLSIENGVEVQKGRILAKILKEGVKTKDITGGLPRVGELFEARRPKNPSVLAQVEGVVRFGSVVKGKRIVIIEDDYGAEYKHQIPMSKHLLVRDGDRVEAAERLCDGPIDPHDILDILGENALQSFLLDEVQEVYRLQGVDINDKHLGVVVRQMLRKVEIIRVGDTGFIHGQQVDKYRFHEENARVIAEGGQPADARPMLLGITRASLSIDSFISAASFQETTKVLTNAAIAGSRDVLRGLKENVIIGHLIPAGTGMKRYRDIRVKEDNPIDLGEKVQSLMGSRKMSVFDEDEEFESDDLEEMISEGETSDDDGDEE